MVVLPLRGILTGWRYGVTGISCSSTTGSAKIYIWVYIIPFGHTGWENWLQCSFAEKDLGVPVDNKLDVSQECAKGGQRYPGMHQNKHHQEDEGVDPPSLVRTERDIWSAVSNSGLPCTGHTQTAPSRKGN